MDEEQRRLAEELLTTKGMQSGFAKALTFGILRPFPPIHELSGIESETTEAFIDNLASFLDDNLDAAEIDKNADIPQSIISGLAELGLLGMTIPQEYDGLGMSQSAYCRAIDTVASHCGATAVFVNAHQSIGLKALLLFGTERQKKKWLPPLASGEQIAAFALTEENAGSDANGVQTTAEYDSEKKVWRLNGKKQWITNGSIAKVLTVMAKTEIETKHGTESKVTAFIVTPDMPGFNITNPALEKVGIRGTRTTKFELNNVEVPEENVLGPIGGGLKVCLTCLDYGRTTFGAMCTGAAKYATRRAVSHATSRYQFNRPLASFPLVKEKIAKMTALAYAMDATTSLTARLVDEGIEDIMIEAAILKVFTSDALWDILYDTMQIFGGRSFFTDEPFERMMRDARLNMIGEGSNEVLRVFIPIVGIRELGIYLKGKGGDNGKLHALMKTIPILWRSITPATFKTKSKHLRREGRALERAVKQYGRDVLKLTARHKEDIIEKQLLLNRLADTLIAIYTVAAVIQKIDHTLMSAKDDINGLRNEVTMAKLYCKIAFSKIDKSRQAQTLNFDKDVELFSDHITGI